MRAKGKAVEKVKAPHIEVMSLKAVPGMQRRYFNDNDRILLHEIIDRMSPVQMRKLGCWLLMRSMGDVELIRFANRVAKRATKEVR
jgi:hypothetical protein